MTAVGAAAAWHYANEGLTLSHYDARAHLVVARRIFDSLMPGWQQIGGVWLPLPHVLNALPVQVDALYRNGASGTIFSVLSMGAAAWGLAALLMRVTGSQLAAILGSFLLLANPNTLYLQSTPMTEPMLFGTTLVCIALTAAWLDRGAPLPPRAAGLAMMAACMTRYEAWPISAGIVVLSGAVLWRRGAPYGQIQRSCLQLSAYSLLAIFLFVVNSRWTTGRWFVGGDFFVAENAALGQPWLAWQQVMEGLYKLSGTATVWPAWLAVVLIVVTFVRSKERASIVLGTCARGCRGGALVRVLQRTSATRTLQPANGHGMHGVHRDRPSPSCRPVCVCFPPPPSSPPCCCSSRPSTGLRRSSPNRSVTLSTGKDDRRSPSTCAIATMVEPS